MLTFDQGDKPGASQADAATDGGADEMDYIILTRRGDSWAVVFKGPSARRLNAIGYDPVTLIPFDARVSERAVRSALQQLNPGIAILGETE